MYLNVLVRFPLAEIKSKKQLREGGGLFPLLTVLRHSLFSKGVKAGAEAKALEECGLLA